MARIVGGIGCTPVPATGHVPAGHLQGDPGWKPFFDGFLPVQAWLAQTQPDVAVVIHNDHGLNFFPDKMPTFAIGTAAEYRNADAGDGLPPHAGDPALSRHLIESLVGEEFDILSCQEMLVDHAFTQPLELLWPGRHPCPVRSVPVCINTLQHPLPTPARCFKLGRAIGRAIESWQSDARVLVIGTGGLSHQIDGRRAGTINKKFDLMFMDTLIADPLWVTRYSILDLIGMAGTQGIELLMWLTMRGALPGEVSKVHANYHVPLANAASGLMVMEGA